MDGKLFGTMAKLSSEGYIFSSIPAFVPLIALNYKDKCKLLLMVGPFGSATCDGLGDPVVGVGPLARGFGDYGVIRVLVVYMVLGAKRGHIREVYLW